MNKEEAAELLPIIKAFSEERPIQYRIRDNKTAIWNDLDKIITNSVRIHFNIALSLNKNIVHLRIQKSAGMRCKSISHLGG